MSRFGSHVSAHWRSLATIAVCTTWAATAGLTAGAQSPRTGDAASSRAGAPAVDIKTLHVQGNVYVLVGGASNIVVQVGPIGPLVVDAGADVESDKVIAAIKALSPRPIRYLINTHRHADHTGGNAQVSHAGASLQVPRQVASETQADVIAHESVLNSMSTPGGTAKPLPFAMWPTSSFSGSEKEIFANGEAVQVIHQPAAHTEGDVFVFFRRSDVLATGDLYSTVTYPVIDPVHGSIQGVLAGLNRLLHFAIPGEKLEGGTMIVPGHGRISDEADLVEYRDMVTIIRDRVADLVKKGMTVQQVKAAKPTLEYDALYNRDKSWTADQFVEAVYRGLKSADR